MIRIILILALQLVIYPKLYAKNQLDILLNTSGENPYSPDATSSSKTLIENAVIDRLIQVSHNMVTPKLLDSAYYDFETKEYVLVLKKNLYFHHNRLATIEDLEFSLLRFYFAAGKSHGIGALDNVLGIDEIQKQQLTKFRSGVVSGVKLVPPNTVRIKLIAPDPNFLYMLSDPAFSLVPEEALDSSYMRWKSIPIGAGSYAIADAGFQDGVVKLKKVNSQLKQSVDRVNIFTKNDPSVEFDISLVQIKDLTEKNYSVFTSRHAISQFGLIFTNVNPLGNNYYFRKFVQAALNSEKFVPYAAGFSSTYEVLPHSKWGTTQLTSPYNPSLAKQYFAKIPKHLREKKWNVTVYSAGNSVRGYKKDFMEEIKKQLGVFGFKMDYIPVTAQFLPKNLAKNTPFDVSSIQIDPYDVLFKYARLLKKGEDEFVKPLPDQKLEKLYATALAAQSLEEKSQIIDKLNKYVHEKAYWVPLLKRKNLIYYNPKTIANLMNENNEISHLNIEGVTLNATP